MANFYEGRSKWIALTGVLIICMIGALLLISGVLKDQSGDLTTETLSVQVLKDKMTSLEDAVSQAIMSQDQWIQGEFLTEVHEILDSTEEKGVVIVYAVVTKEGFGYANGLFVPVSGASGCAVITFKYDKASGYQMIDYKKPMDGAGYSPSVKEMFPKRLWTRVLSGEGPAGSEELLQKKAQNYLKSIGQ